MSPPARAALHPAVLVGFGALYFAQGVPLGIAAEYLPVLLRENHASYSFLAAVGWLQLPWTLKVLWSRAGDVPALRARARAIVLALQLALALVIALYALQPFARAPTFWLVLTGGAALLASTQDVFVDGLAVRTLGEQERGLGNVAQVGAYRVGMVAGGAGLLSLGGLLSERVALLTLAGLVAAAGVGVLVVGERAAPAPAADPYRQASAPQPAWAQPLATARAMLRPPARRVLVVAFAFKLGLHAAASLLKPALVDGGWSKERIGTLAVTVGTLAGVLGALAGGLLHRRLGDRRALRLAAFAQALSCLPLVLVVTHAANVPLVTAAMAVEHAVSGLGTTILFAALMGATSRARAAQEFTVLVTANAVSLAVGSAAAGALADVAGVRVVFVLGALLSLAAVRALRGWDDASAGLRDAPAQGSGSWGSTGLRSTTTPSA